MWTLGSGLLWVAHVLCAQPSVPLQQVINEFGTPNMAARPMFRWWWPHGLVDHEQIKLEIDQMIEVGFGGAEIEDVHHSITGSLDPAGHGWGTNAWKEAIAVALEYAISREFRIDIAIGPSWPAAIPSITPDSDAAAKELAYGVEILEDGNTFDGEIPRPEEPKQGLTSKATLFAAQAWSVESMGSTNEEKGRGRSGQAKTTSLHQNSFVNLTGSSNNSVPAFNPNFEGQTAILSTWVRGSGQKPEGGSHTTPESFVVDHFSKRGVDAIIKFWEEHIINDRIRLFLKQNGGSIFEDSIELDSTGYWTPELDPEFKRHKGYDLQRYLPVILRQIKRPLFTFNDNRVSKQFRNDYWNVLGSMFLDNHLKPLQQWAKTLNMTLRAQPYGLQTDAMGACAFLDIPEGETLSFKNLDDFRTLASAAHLTGRNIVSSETGAVRNGAYSMTLERLLRIINPTFATGINQHVLHGFSYSGSVPHTSWPGFGAFSPMKKGPGYSESWGSRQPMWTNMKEVGDYLARVQSFLRKGVPQYDIAFFAPNGYVGSGLGGPWLSKEGIQQGYSLGYLSPSLLDLPQTKVVNGRLAVDTVNYGALVLANGISRDDRLELDLRSVNKLLEFAQSGLPVLILGHWDEVASFGKLNDSDFSTLQSRFQQLLSEPKVFVTSNDRIRSTLEDLNIRPSVLYEKSSPLIYHRRVDGSRTFWTFVNSAKNRQIDHDITLYINNHNATIFEFDPWSGTTRQAPLFESVSNEGLLYHVKLDPEQVLLLIADFPQDPMLHVVRISHPDSTVLIRSGMKLQLQAQRTGQYEIKLSDGSTVTPTIESIPERPELGSWTLQVQSWLPKDEKTTQTQFQLISVKLKGRKLKPWNQIEELKDLSGIGNYSTTFDVGGLWPTNAGAMLKLGKVEGAIKIWVNGQQVKGIDLLADEHDLGTTLKAGINELTVQVATTLANRLRVVLPGSFGTLKPQEYGLLGPVVVKPYVLVDVN
jgi:hypothetical protein